MRKRNSATIEERFWAKVNKNGPLPSRRPELGPCWLWTSNTVRGYGQYHLPRNGNKQRNVYAHRFAYELTHGLIGSSRLQACHRCDTPLCVNPAHIFIGPAKANLDDARSKGRLIDGKHKIKLSDAAIADIRTNYVPRKNGKILAAKYSVTLTSILRTFKGRQRVQRPIDKLFEPAALSGAVVRVPYLGEVA